MDWMHQHSQQRISSKYPMLSTTSPPMDPYMPLNQLISQARRYLGNDEGIPNLEALWNLLQMTTAQIEYAATRRNQSFKLVKPHDFKVGDLVLVRNHISKAFQENYQDSFHVVWLLGKNQLEVKDQKGHIRQVHITDVKKITMSSPMLFLTTLHLVML